MRILFVTSNRLGDAVLSTGLLDHLIHAHPDARITIACGPVAEGVFARMPNHERTIVLDKRSYSMHWLPLWASAATTLWDLVVDIRGSARSRVPRRSCASRRRRAARGDAKSAPATGSCRSGSAAPKFARRMPARRVGLCIQRIWSRFP